jgi:hypothetical protein
VLDALVVYTAEPVILTLWIRGHHLYEGLREAVGGVATVEGFPVCMRLKFANPEQPVAFGRAMLERGVILHWNDPKQQSIYSGPILPMYSHTEQQIDQVIAAAKESAQEIAAGS